MKLQLALDRLTKETCIQLATETIDSVDVIEIGTGVIKEYGMPIVREMRQLFPKTCILADMKICDAGKHEARQAFEAGADIVTVMAFASDQTIQDTLHVAKEMNKKTMVDLLEVHSSERVKELDQLGVTLVSLHVGKDTQSKSGFHSGLFSIIDGFDFNVAVAGGIQLENVAEIVSYCPHYVIVGSAITGAESPAEAAREIKKQLQA